MAWLIEARNKAHGTQWEPIRFHPIQLPDGSPEYQFEYETIDEAAAALKKFLEISDGLPALVVRMATGRPRRFLDHYELRFVMTTQETPAEGLEALAEIYENQAAIERERAERDGK